MRLGEPDAKGRRKPVPVEGSNFSIACDTAILALGYWPDPILGKTTPGLEVNDWGLIAVKDKKTGATSPRGRLLRRRLRHRARPGRHRHGRRTQSRLGN